MPAPIACRENSALNLATMLFEEVSSLTIGPSDGVYADYLLALAFSHLVTGLESEQLDGSGRLRAAADAIEGCNWLSEAVREHVSRTLRLAAEGGMPLAAMVQIALSARNRTNHQMILDLARSVASEGLLELAGAVEIMTETVANKARH